MEQRYLKITFLQQGHIKAGICKDKTHARSLWNVPRGYDDVFTVDAYASRACVVRVSCRVDVLFSPSWS